MPSKDRSAEYAANAAARLARKKLDLLARSYGVTPNEVFTAASIELDRRAREKKPA